MIICSFPSRAMYRRAKIAIETYFGNQIIVDNIVSHLHGGTTQWELHIYKPIVNTKTGETTGLDDMNEAVYRDPKSGAAVLVREVSDFVDAIEHLL